MNKYTFYDFIHQWAEQTDLDTTSLQRCDLRESEALWTSELLHFTCTNWPKLTEFGFPVVQWIKKNSHQGTRGSHMIWD